MAEREHKETCLGDNVRQSLSVNHYEEVDTHESAIETSNVPVVLQTRRSGDNGRNHCEHRDEIKNNELKWLVVSFVLAAVIITGIFLTAFILREDQKTKIILENLKKTLASRIDEVDQKTKILLEKLKKTLTIRIDEVHGEDQKTKILLKNFRKTLTIRIDELHGKDNHTALLLKNLQKNLTSFINKAHVEDQKTKILLENLKKTQTSRIDEVNCTDNHTALLLENLQKNLTSFINKAHSEDQKTKILLENLMKTLTIRIDEVHGKDNHTALLLENLQKNLTSFINKAIGKNQQMKTNLEVLQKNLSSIMDISLQHSLNISTMHERNDLLERQIQELNSTILRLQNKVAAIECQDGFHYLTNCYFAIIHASEDIEFRNKNSTCGSRGGRIGNILNLDHQILIEYYVRPKIPAAQDSTQMWLALIYNSSTKALTTSDGNSFPSASLRWHPDYPKSYSNVFLEVFKDPSTLTGAHNVRAYASTVAYGVFCEK